MRGSLCAARSEEYDVPMSAESQSLSVADLPISHFIWKLTLLSSAGVFLDGFDVSIMSGALIFIKPEFHPSPLELGFIGAATVVGMFFGSIVLGNLADRLGRRGLYMVDLLFFVVFAILTALSTSSWELIVFRFLLGVGLGADYPISSTITAEFAPRLKRGRLLVVTIGAFTAGAIAAYIVATAFFYTGHWNWRYMLAFGAIPALVVTFMRRSVPESPAWLRASGRGEEADAVVAQIAEYAGQLDAQNAADAANAPTPEHHHKRSAAAVKLGSLGRLFRKPLLAATVVAGGCWLLFDLGNYATIVFTPTILSGFTKGAPILSVVVPIGTNLVGLFGIFICYQLVDRIGRKKIQWVGFLVLGIVFIALGLLPTSAQSFGVMLAFFILVLLFDQAPGITTYLFAGELFPTAVRSSGHAVATAASRIGAFLGIVALPLFMAKVGLGPAMITFGICDLAAMALTLWLAPEMRDRDLLEDEDVEEHSLVS